MTEEQTIENAIKDTIKRYADIYRSNLSTKHIKSNTNYHARNFIILATGYDPELIDTYWDMYIGMREGE